MADVVTHHVHTSYAPSSMTPLGIFLSHNSTMMFQRVAVGTTAVLLLALGADGFATIPAAGRATTKLFSSSEKTNIPVSTGYDSFERLKTLTNIPSGENQRAFRRTVYTHDDWVRHRRQERFVVYLAAIFKSGVYKNLAGEVILATSIASFVVVWNIIAGGYTDLSGVSHPALIQSSLFPKIGLPMAAFTLTSPALGLLLGTLPRM